MEDKKPLEGEELLDAIAKKLKVKPDQVDESLSLVIPVILSTIELCKLIEDSKPSVGCEKTRIRETVSALLAALDMSVFDLNRLMERGDLASALDTSNDNILVVLDRMEPVFLNIVKITNWFQRETIDLNCKSIQEADVINNAIRELSDVHLKNFMVFANKLEQEKQELPPTKISPEKFQEMVDEAQEGGKHDGGKGTISIPRADQGCGSKG